MTVMSPKGGAPRGTSRSSESNYLIAGSENPLHEFESFIKHIEKIQDTIAEATQASFADANKTAFADNEATASQSTPEPSSSDLKCQSVSPISALQGYAHLNLGHHGSSHSIAESELQDDGIADEDKIEQEETGLVNKDHTFISKHVLKRRRGEAVKSRAYGCDVPDKSYYDDLNDRANKLAYFPRPPSFYCKEGEAAFRLARRDEALRGSCAKGTDVEVSMMVRHVRKQENDEKHGKQGANVTNEMHEDVRFDHVIWGGGSGNNRNGIATMGVSKKSNFTASSKWRKIRTVVKLASITKKNNVNPEKVRAEHLARQLGHKNDNIRRDACKSLAGLRFRTPVVMDMLIGALEDPSDIIKYEASKTLILLGVWKLQAIDHILKSFKTGNRNIKIDVIKTLTESEPAASSFRGKPLLRLVETLIITAGEDDDELRHLSAVCLAHLSFSDATAYTYAYTAVTDELMKHVWDPTESKRSEALQILVKQMQVKDGDIVDSVINLLKKGQSWKNRATAARLLIFLGNSARRNKNVFNQLISSLWDEPDKTVRKEILRSITGLGFAKQVFEYVFKMLEGPDAKLREQAVLSFCAMGVKSGRVIKLLISTLEKEGNMRVRMAILNTFMELEVHDQNIIRVIEEIRGQNPEEALFHALTKTLIHLQNMTKDKPVVYKKKRHTRANSRQHHMIEEVSERKRSLGISPAMRFAADTGKEQKDGRTQSLCFDSAGAASQLRTRQETHSFATAGLPGIGIMTSTHTNNDGLRPETLQKTKPAEARLHAGTLEARGSLGLAHKMKNRNTWRSGDRSGPRGSLGPRPLSRGASRDRSDSLMQPEGLIRRGSNILGW